MSITKVKTLYDSDFALWIEETVKHLKSGQLENLDIENLIEEIESLGRSDKRELENRLITLFEHALKRKYVDLSDCYRGWEVTLSRTQYQLNRILSDSPSLKSYLINVMNKCYQVALKNMRQEYEINFPEINPFSPEIDILLNSDFWQK